ncbi:MAG TPA: hypothetical protein ENH75_00300 [archaeon]|nr:hypothetical protein [archaeon]
MITRTGRMVWVTLITNQKIILIAREILSSFTQKFEIIFNQELKDLYTILKGNVSIFRQSSRLKDLKHLINNEFYLQYTSPYKTGSLKGKKLTSISKKIYQIAKSLSHKKKSFLLLKDLLSKTNSSTDFNNVDSSNIIYELVQNNALIPVPSDLSKKKLLIH